MITFVVSYGYDILEATQKQTSTLIGVCSLSLKTPNSRGGAESRNPDVFYELSNINLTRMGWGETLRAGDPRAFLHFGRILLSCRVIV